MSRLSSSTSCNELSASTEAAERTVCPIDLNLRCHSNGETALHAAVRGRHKEIVSALLAAGADADVLAQEPHPDQVIFGSFFLFCLCLFGFYALPISVRGHAVLRKKGYQR